MSTCSVRPCTWHGFIQTKGILCVLVSNMHYVHAPRNTNGTPTLVLQEPSPSLGDLDNFMSHRFIHTFTSPALACFVLLEEVLSSTTQQGIITTHLGLHCFLLANHVLRKLLLASKCLHIRGDPHFLAVKHYFATGTLPRVTWTDTTLQC